MAHGFFRVASSSPDIIVADCTHNATEIINAVKEASKNEVSLIVFPELSLTGSTCGDLFLQKTLQKSAIEQTLRIANECKNLPILIAVGIPFLHGNLLYNCAALLFKGKIIALVPKTYISTKISSNESHYFASLKNNSQNCTNEILLVNFSNENPYVPFSPNIIISSSKNENISIAIEIGNDLFAPIPPSTFSALNGAAIIANLSATNQTPAMCEHRKKIIESHSSLTMCAYIYTDCSKTESTQDEVFSGHKIIAELGDTLEEAIPFSANQIYADIDTQKILQERIFNKHFFENQIAQKTSSHFQKVFIDFELEKKQIKSLYRKINAYPFIPEDENALERYCKNILELQSNALSKRLNHINAKSVVLGLSGGLDSTLALLVIERAFSLCNLDKKNILCITMPCFGTTDRTYNNAINLSKEIGATLREINIAQSVLQHFKDIAHDSNIHDVTFENSQARERTQILMDIANKENALVIGTGDLSELALGWCTYNGDHMSMYGVNSSIPKTLVRHLVMYEKNHSSNKKLSSVLNDILETPVSPELLPPENGNISQKTENIVGPYDLHDFFLYHTLKHGFTPEKILFLADNSSLPFSRAEKLKWMKVFYKRFFSQQFKRSCMPDGASVTGFSLSPRNGLHMPSDASANAWLLELGHLS